MIPFDQKLVEFYNCSTEMEALVKQFNTIADLESHSVAVETLNLTYSAEIGNVISEVSEGLTNKTKNAISNAAKNTANSAAKAVTNGTLIEKAKQFVNKLSEFINSVSTAMSKMLASGFPLMGALKNSALSIKASLESAQQIEVGVRVKNANKHLIIGDSIANPVEIIKVLGYTLDIEKKVLTKSKLDDFKQLSDAVLEPFSSSIKQSKVDSVVMCIGVLSLLTNPGAVAGVVLKRLFQAANPGLGEKVEKALTLGGGVYNGIAALVVASGSASGSYLRQMQAGRLNIKDIPKFKPLYPFCTQKVEDDSALTETTESEILLGNRSWKVTDYVDQLSGDMKGGVTKVGASFKPIKSEVKVEATELPPLSKEQINQICDLIIEMMNIGQTYCKAWPDYAKTYNDQYRRISDIVMTHPDSSGDENRSLTAHYVRYTYRNAMNVMLGGVWNNCFGADNQFTRYLVSLCRTLIGYCNASIKVAKD
jgi:hypothetical protein